MRICLCLIKGSNFLFISGPHPPTESSCLLIPPLQTAPTPPTPFNPHPGPPCWCPARLCFSLLHSRAGDWEAIRFVSAGSRLSTNKSSLSRAGVVTEEEEGGIAVWFLFKSRYTHTQAWEGARGAEGLIELQAWDQSPSRPQAGPGRAVVRGHRSRLHNCCLL